MDKVQDIKRPLKLGEEYLVPCLVKRDSSGAVLSFTPVFSTSHTDKENGQIESHYHADCRFVAHEDNPGYGVSPVITDEREGFKNMKSRAVVGVDGELEYHVLPVVRESHAYVGLLLAMKRSKLKHKCIHKGKCPHRGYDLSQEKAVDGVITCPQHGLRFDSNTGEITKECMEVLVDMQNRDKEYGKISGGLISKISNIKDGDTISEKYYIQLKKDNRIFHVTEDEDDGLLSCTWVNRYDVQYGYWPLRELPEDKYLIRSFKVKKETHGE